MPDRPTDSGELLAAALCHLVSADQQTLDPDGAITSWAWPYREEFEPAETDVENLAKAAALINEEIGRLTHARTTGVAWDREWASLSAEEKNQRIREGRAARSARRAASLRAAAGGVR